MESRLELLKNEIEKLYQRIDADSQAFNAVEGLRCPSGCGACCTYPDVSCTVLEILPLAFQFLQAGTAESWLQRLENESHPRCPFFASQGGDKGSCTEYPLRPAVCR